MTEKLNLAVRSQRIKSTLQDYWRISEPNLTICRSKIHTYKINRR